MSVKIVWNGAIYNSIARISYAAKASLTKPYVHYK